MNQQRRGRHLVARRPRLRHRRRPARAAVRAAASHGIARPDRRRASSQGGIEATLPDGSFRVLGGRGDGAGGVVHLQQLARAGRGSPTSGSVGWYKAWARGEWSSPDPVPLFDLFMRNAATPRRHRRAPRGRGGWSTGSPIALRANDRARARRNIAHHYDLGNDFYAAWLDPGMTYSSAIFAEPIRRDEPLEAAQERKIRLLLDRLDLKPGQRLLEIGCGWGGLAEIAARDYGVHVTGLTLSAEQKAYAEARLAAGRAGRPGRRSGSTDYRDVDGHVRRGRQRRDGRGGRPGILAGLSRRASPGR